VSESASIDVYLLNTNLYPTEQIYHVFHKLSPVDRKRSANFVKENDRIRFFAGRYLLDKYLHVINAPETLQQIQHDTFKRPRLPETTFSISHSENWVALAAGNSNINIGVDLEVGHPLFVPDYLEPFCEEEKSYILEKNTLSRFYRIWTKKESALKAIGKGFLHNALEINTKMEYFVYENKKYKWTTVDIADDVICHICHDQHDFALNIKLMPDQL
jgi:4'-phosphopantetheinyl transferase